MNSFWKIFRRTSSRSSEGGREDAFFFFAESKGFFWRKWTATSWTWLWFWCFLGGCNPTPVMNKNHVSIMGMLFSGFHCCCSKGIRNGGDGWKIFVESINFWRSQSWGCVKRCWYPTNLNQDDPKLTHLLKRKCDWEKSRAVVESCEKRSIDIQIILLMEEIPNNHLTRMKPWHVWNPVNNGINYLSTGAGFLPSTVEPRIWSIDFRIIAYHLDEPNHDEWKIGWNFRPSIHEKHGWLLGTRYLNC